MSAQTSSWPSSSEIVPPQRSSASVAFEAHWRGLPKQELIPHRREFKPERAQRFLKHIVLIEAPTGANARLRIRLVGSAVQDRIKRDVRDHDYLDFLAPVHHHGAVESGRLLLGQPCGLWQVMVVHYEREFAEPLEVTAFPLSADADGVPLLLCLVMPLAKLIEPDSTLGRIMVIETAQHFRFIDVGAGVPDWPPSE